MLDETSRVKVQPAGDPVNSYPGTKFKIVLVPTLLSPFEHCPLAIHCQQSPRLLCSACDHRAPHRLTRPAFEAHPGAITFPPEESSQRRSSNGPIRFPHHLFSDHDHGRLRSSWGPQHLSCPYVGLTAR